MKLTGDDGREYLDFLAGIGVCSLGHGDPAVLSALEAQTKKLMHVSNYFYIEQRGQVAALLSDTSMLASPRITEGELV